MLINKSKSPLYYQLAEIIIEEIKSRNLKENDKILTEREYCEKYNLSSSFAQFSTKRMDTGL